jgi:hypothetical protein
MIEDAESMADVLFWAVFVIAVACAGVFVCAV